MFWDDFNIRYLSANSKQYFPDVHGGVHGFGVAPVNVRNVQPNGNNAQPNRFGGGGWGAGQRLGAN